MKNSKDEKKLSRADIDDVYRRNNAKNSYKNRHFDGKRTAQDEYQPGNIVHYSDRGVNSDQRFFKTGSTSNTDHVTPVDRIKEEYKDLKPEQIKEMANSDYNLAITNEKLNKAKGKMKNHEYLISQYKKGEPENIRTTVAMLHKEAYSETMFKIDGTAGRTKNVYKNITGNYQYGGQIPIKIIQDSADFSKEAIKAIDDNAISLTMLGLNQSIQVLNGEKDVDEALKETAWNVAGVGVKAGVKGVVLKNLSPDKMLHKVLNSNNINQIIMVATVISNSTIRYINGEIDEKELVKEVRENSMIMAASVIGQTIGGSFGGPLGAFVCSTLATMTVCMVNSAVEKAKATLIGMKNSYQSITKEHQAYLRMLDNISSQATMELESQREEMRKIFATQEVRWTKAMDDGFEKIKEGALNNSMQEINKGLGEILELFDAEVRFHNASEVRSFMNSKERIFIL